MDKFAAAEFLGVSPRSVERYIKAKILGVSYIKGKPEFDESELTRFKNEMNSPIHNPRIDPATRDDMALSSAVVSDAMHDGLNHLEAIAYHYYLTALQTKMVLSLTEASLLSGMSVNLLLKHIKSGDLNAIKLGRGWKVRTKDIVVLVDLMFEKQNRYKPKAVAVAMPTTPSTISLLAD